MNCTRHEKPCMYTGVKLSTVCEYALSSLITSADVVHCTYSKKIVHFLTGQINPQTNSAFYRQGHLHPLKWCMQYRSSSFARFPDRSDTVISSTLHVTVFVTYLLICLLFFSFQPPHFANSHLLPSPNSHFWSVL